MNTTTADLLQQMIDIKKNTREAIAGKGVEIVGGMITYPQAIGAISQMFVGSEIDFTRAGWLKSNSDETNRLESNYINDALSYANLLWRLYGDMSTWEKNSIYTKNPLAYDTNMVIAPGIQVSDSMERLTSNKGWSDICGLFEGCSSLRYVPNIDFTPSTKEVYAEHMFEGCGELRVLGELKTSNVVNMSDMFKDCSSLTSIPQMDTSNVTAMYQMFFNCTKLTTIPQLDTSNVGNMNSMFYNCSSLTSIPQMDTSNVVYMYDMFRNCTKLTTIPQLDTSNVKSMTGMFENCSSLTSIPQLDTSNVMTMLSMFSGCYNLESLPLLNCESVTDMNYIFSGGTTLSKLKNLGGFKGLKVSVTAGFLENLPSLTYRSLINVIDNLATVSSGELKFGSQNIHLLTDEDIEIATNKGWTLLY